MSTPYFKTYSVSTDTANGAVFSSSLKNEYEASDITVALSTINVSGDVLTIYTKAAILGDDITRIGALVAAHAGEVIVDSEKVKALNYPVSDNHTTDGKVLYIKVHGQKHNIAAGEVKEFKFTIPYTEVYFQGAEIMQDIIGVADFSIDHPLTGQLEQYGYAVNLGTIKYMRESKYAARLPQGLIINCKYTNDTTEEQEVGVNFLLHDIREES
jgi:hypothetical protein